MSDKKYSVNFAQAKVNLAAESFSMALFPLGLHVRCRDWMSHARSDDRQNDVAHVRIRAGRT
jgi:hypothetical protein